jgi:hypothetical protein
VKATIIDFPRALWRDIVAKRNRPSQLRSSETALLLTHESIWSAVCARAGATASAAASQTAAAGENRKFLIPLLRY